MAQTKLNLSLRQWMVMFSSFLVNSLCMGFFFVFGQLFVAIRNTFNSTTAETVLVQSVTIAVMHVTAVPVGAFIHKYGPRTAGIFGTALISVGFVSSFFATSIGFLGITIGIFVATGMSALRVSNTIATREHFTATTACSLALSFISVGTSVGGMVYPYFIQYFSEMFALRGCLLMIGALLLHSLPCALLWSPPEKTQEKSIEIPVINMPQEYENRNITHGNSESIIYELSRSTSSHHRCSSDDGENSPRVHHKDNANAVCNTKTNTSTKHSLTEVLTDKVFLTFCFASCLSFSGLSVFLIFIVDLFLDKGFSEYDAAFALMLMNVMNLIGRVLPGFLRLLPHVTALLIPILASLLGAISVIAIVFAVQLNLLLFLSGVFGFVLGIIASTLTVTTANLVDASNFPNASGTLLTVIGIGSSSTGPINGVIRDKTGSYVLPFILSSSSVFIAFLLYCVAQLWRRRLKNRTFVIG